MSTRVSIKRVHPRFSPDPIDQEDQEIEQIDPRSRCVNYYLTVLFFKSIEGIKPSITASLTFPSGGDSRSESRDKMLQTKSIKFSFF